MSSWQKPPEAEKDSASQWEVFSAIMRSAYRLRQEKAPARAWIVASAVWDLTFRFTKIADVVYVDELASITGLNARSVSRGLADCHKAGALVWQPERSGKRTRSLVKLPTGDSSVTLPDSSSLEEAESSSTGDSSDTPDLPTGDSSVRLPQLDMDHAHAQEQVRKSLDTETKWKGVNSVQGGGGLRDDVTFLDRSEDEGTPPTENRSHMDHVGSWPAQVVRNMLASDDPRLRALGESIVKGEPPADDVSPD